MKVRKFLVIIVMIMITIGLVGCAGNISDVKGVNDVTTALNNRLNLNKQILEDYHNAGLIDDSTYANILQSINSKIASIDTMMGSNDLSEGSKNEISLVVSSMVFCSDSLGEYTYSCKSTGVNGNSCSHTAEIIINGHKVNGGGSGDFIKGYIEPTNVGYNSICGRSFHLSGNSGNNCIDRRGTNKIGYGVDFLGVNLQKLILMDLTGTDLSKYNFYQGFNGVLKSDKIDSVDPRFINPYEIIETDMTEEINKMLAAKIYVLSPDKVNDIAIDDISTQLQAIRGLNASNTTVSGNTNISNINISSTGVLSYFTEAKNDKEEPLTFLDITKRENQAVITSSYEGKNYGTNKSDCGKDLMIRVGGESGYDGFCVRLNEFNGELYSKLLSNGFLGDDNWLLYNNGNDVRLYLLQYPVYVIKDVKEGNNNDIYFDSFEKTDMMVNIMTGETSKASSYWGETSDEYTNIVNKGTPYLITTINGSTVNNIKDSVSSYIIHGYDKHFLNDSGYTTSGVHSNFKIGRIVLRDYLEATYMPNVVGNDKLVVYGRKIRFNEFPTSDNPVSKNVPLANYVNAEGVKIEGSSDLFCDDFGDIEKLTSDTPQVNYIKWRTDKDKDAENVSSISESLSDALGQSKYLKYMATNKIVLSSNKYAFPGQYIDKTDAGNNGLPLFYCVSTIKGVGENGIMNWINSDNEANSYKWWSKWLDTNGYNYQLAGSTLEALFEGSYQYGAAATGYVTLNLDTIDRIQKEYEKEDDVNNVSRITTIFKLLGWALVLLGTLLPLLWVVDTSFDLGIKFIETLSNGMWIPVKDNDDVPNMDTEDRHYLSLGGVLKKSLVVIMVGILLIRVNIIRIVVTLLDVFGGIGEYITKLILGK